MSALELRAMLADASQNGAYFVDVRDREALEEAALSLRYAVAPIDCAGCGDKHEILARFAQALRFPDWFGDSWDALVDCLGDLSWWPADGYLLLVEHAGAWRTDDAEAFGVLLDILNEAARKWGERRVPFWALIPLSAAALAEIDPET